MFSIALSDQWQGVTSATPCYTANIMMAGLPAILVRRSQNVPPYLFCLVA